MKPSMKKAGISSELTHNAQQPTVNDCSEMERMDREFFVGLAQIGELIWKGEHEEDIRAIQVLENAYCESKAAMAILMRVLFLNEDVTSEILACAERCMPEQDYQFLMKLLRGFTGLSLGTPQL